MPGSLLKTEANFDLQESLPAKTLAFPTEVYVPSLAPIHFKAPAHAATTISNTKYTHNTDFLKPVSVDERLDWTLADLDFLVGILYSDLALNARLTFRASSPNSSHHSLKLYITPPSQPIPRNAYDRNAPIGTGRPAPTQLLAESSPFCKTPSEARRSLACNLLLQDIDTVNDICMNYLVLYSLYSRSRASLLHVQRGVEGMMGISMREWDERLWQMRIVDEEYPLGDRIERTLLQTGPQALGAWAGAVEVGLGLEDQERAQVAETYGEAGRFLRKACLL